MRNWKDELKITGIVLLSAIPFSGIYYVLNGLINNNWNVK